MNVGKDDGEIELIAQHRKMRALCSWGNVAPANESGPFGYWMLTDEFRKPSARQRTNRRQLGTPYQFVIESPLTDLETFYPLEVQGMGGSSKEAQTLVIVRLVRKT